MGRKCREFYFFFSFLVMLDIVCIFAWYLNSLCINLLCLDMIESLRLYIG
jgi:hypothetical protein